jgi:protein O-mannosyl-transferase
MHSGQAGSDDEKNKLPTFLKWSPLAIIFLTAILYYRAVCNGLTSFDDAFYVNNNPFLKDFSWSGIKAIFTSFYSCNYHPLTILTYLFEYRFFEINPLPYHLTNVLLHLFNTWFVFLLAERLSGRKVTAIVVSLLFAVHPMHVESVAWVSERKDVLFSFFYLLSLLSYLSYLRYGFRKKYYVGMFLFFVASLLSKPAAVTLPVLLIVIDLYKGRAIQAKVLIEKIPLLLLSFVFGILNIVAQTGSINIVDTSFGFFNRLFLVTYTIAWYLFSLPVPYNLSGMHYYPTMSAGLLPWQYYSSLPLLAIVALLVWRLIRRSSFRKEIVFGCSFFLVTIFLTLQAIPVGSSLVAERYTYIPYIGLAYIVGQCLSETKNVIGRYAGIGIFSVLTIVFCSITWSRIAVWKDDYTLYGDMIEKNAGSPYNFYAYFVLGMDKYNEGKLKESLQDINDCISLDPGYAVAYNIRGGLYAQLNDPKSALIDFTRAISLDPEKAIFYNNRASLNARLGNFREAISDYDSYLDMDPRSCRAYADRGMVRLNLSDSTGACGDFRKSLQFGNSDAELLLRQYCH